MTEYLAQHYGVIIFTGAILVTIIVFAIYGWIQFRKPTFDKSLPIGKRGVKMVGNINMEVGKLSNDLIVLKLTKPVDTIVMDGKHTGSLIKALQKQKIKKIRR